MKARYALLLLAAGVQLSILAAAPAVLRYGDSAAARCVVARSTKPLVIE
jgi:hypothetical protein